MMKVSAKPAMCSSMKLRVLAPLQQVNRLGSILPNYTMARYYASSGKKPVTLSWTKLADAPTDISSHGADLIENRIQVWSPQNFVFKFKTCSYDIEKNTWGPQTTISGPGPIIFKNSRVYGFRCGNKTVVIGKTRRGGFNLFALFQPNDRTFIIDDKNTTSRLAPKTRGMFTTYSPVKIDHPTRPLWLVGDNYISTNMKGALQLTYFDLTTEKWVPPEDLKVENVEAGPVPDSRKEIMTASIGKKIYTFHTVDGEPRVHMFDTETNRWNKIKATGIPAMRGAHLTGASTVAFGHLILLMGMYDMTGTAYTVYQDNIYCFDTKQNDWRTVKSSGDVKALTLCTLTKSKEDEAILVGGWNSKSVYKLKLVDQ